MYSDDEIRLRMLTLLYFRAKEHPRDFGMGRQHMIDSLQIEENIMDFNMLYLEQKRLVEKRPVELERVHGSAWYIATITADGIDVIEHKDRYRDQFPFVQATIVQGNIYGPVTQVMGSNVKIQQINETFEKARQITNIRDELSNAEKQEIIQKLNSLEEELRKENPDASKTQEFLNWLKKNASWLFPTLSQIALELSRRIFGL